MQQGRSRYEWVLWILTAECLLKQQPNSGKVVVSRSLIIATWVYLFAVLIKNCPGCYHFSSGNIALAIAETVHWWGAIFGGVYASLYARYASQWTYLSGLFNQIAEVEVGAPLNNGKALARWKAAFIEDAAELHLARKLLFASVIEDWGNELDVREEFEGHAVGGAERLDLLVRSAKKARDAIGAKYPNEGAHHLEQNKDAP